jgi:[acyl-carrier-protein] S-malonyltransferase
MAPGAQRLERALASVTVLRPAFPVFSNVTGRAVTDAADVRRNLVAQVTSPVRFMDCVRSARAAGMARGIEVAPGTVLAAFVKRIEPDVPVVGAPNAAALEALAAGRRA